MIHPRPSHASRAPGAGRAAGAGVLYSFSSRAGHLGPPRSDGGHPLPVSSHEPGGTGQTAGIPKPKPASIRYLGFRCTGAGREYSLRVDSGGDPRLFVLVIPHAAFAARQARFQDAPDLCFAKLQRELAADSTLVAGPPLVLTAADLAEYRDAQTKRSGERKRHRAASTTQ